MKWCRVRSAGKETFAIREGDDIVEVDGSSFTEYTMTRRRQPLAAVQLLVPVIPPNFYAVGPTPSSRWGPSSPPASIRGNGTS